MAFGGLGVGLPHGKVPPNWLRSANAKKKKSQRDLVDFLQFMSQFESGRTAKRGILETSKRKGLLSEDSSLRL